MTDTYTVTGVVHEATNRLLISGTYEGHLESVCDPGTARLDRGYRRWAGTFEADSSEDAEAQARRDHGGYRVEAGELRAGDAVLIDKGNGAGWPRTVESDASVLRHSGGYREAVVRFNNGTTWTGDAATQFTVR